MSASGNARSALGMAVMTLILVSTLSGMAVYQRARLRQSLTSAKKASKRFHADTKSTEPMRLRMAADSGLARWLVESEATPREAIKGEISRLKLGETLGYEVMLLPLDSEEERWLVESRGTIATEGGGKTRALTLRAEVERKGGRLVVTELEEQK